MTQGTTIATVSVVAVAATKIAGLVGMMIDAMMTGVMMTGVTMTAVMTNGGTKVDEETVGWGEDIQKIHLWSRSFDSVHNPFDRRLSLSILFLPSVLNVYQPAVHDPIHLTDIKLSSP